MIRAVLVVIAALLLGCVRVTPELPAGPIATTANAGWYAVKVRVHWPESDEPSWSVDPLLANEVFAPAIKAVGVPMLWRFHRRAVRDSAGHLFSFHYFVSPEVALRVRHNVSSSDVLQLLRDRQVVEEVWFDDNPQPYLAGSDPSWSSELQAGWPYFITGVSAAWLEMVQQRLPESRAGKSDIQSLLAAYRAVDTEVSAIWSFEGQHAFLHHLSGVFGYKPLKVQREIQF